MSYLHWAMDGPQNIDQSSIFVCIRLYSNHLSMLISHEVLMGRNDKLTISGWFPNTEKLRLSLFQYCKNKSISGIFLGNQDSQHSLNLLAKTWPSRIRKHIRNTPLLLCLRSILPWTSFQWKTTSISFVSTGY